MVTGKTKLRNQKAIHKFLLKRYQSQTRFRKSDVRAVTDWAESSFNAYWTKQIERLLAPTKNGKYRVSEAFRSYLRWDKFRTEIATQNRKGSTEYSTMIYDHVLAFDFLMPLRNEGQLRDALDSLFFEDRLRLKLKQIGMVKLRRHFPKRKDENAQDYYERLLVWISSRFGGYSISHCNGRFRAGALQTRAEAAKSDVLGESYLIDETTAVARFIFHCGDPAIKANPPLSSDYFEFESFDGRVEERAKKDANSIRWFFGVLFVQSIVQTVNGEAEIWMVESGMGRHRLYIWEAEG